MRNPRERGMLRTAMLLQTNRLPAWLSPGSTAATTAAARIPAASTFLRLGLIDGQPPAVNFLLIEGLARRFPGFGAAHFDEREPARPPGCLVGDQADGRHLAVWGEELLDLRLIGVERQIAYVNPHRTLQSTVGDSGRESFWSVQPHKADAGRTGAAGSNVHLKA